MKTVVIVGRPNVGKSSLFNRLLGRRIAIVEEQPGSTRDWLEGIVRWRDAAFRIIDTGGLIPAPEELIQTIIQEKVHSLLAGADLVLFVCDARADITAADIFIADLLRQHRVPVLLVANKCDDQQHDIAAYSLSEVGIGEQIVPISALHNRNLSVLLDTILQYIGDAPADAAEEEHLPKIAIVGRPNVGKSSLLNQIAGYERSIVTPEAGTTRDTIDLLVTFEGQKFVLLDTAGIRRKSRIQQPVEYFSFVRSQKAIRRSDVVLLLIDAQEGFHNLEKQLYSIASAEAKGICIGVNKWDLVRETGEQREEWMRQHLSSFPFVSQIPVVFVSAKTGFGIRHLVATLLDIYRKRGSRISTSQLNKLLQECMAKSPPPSKNGKEVKINYASQVAVHPPKFLFFTNHPKWIPDFYKRYLEKRIREAFDLQGVSFQIEFRSKYGKSH